MAITLFGTSAIPTDNGTNATTTITPTPPASMQVGDLVVVICRQRGSTVWTLGLDGGQTWTNEGNNTQTATVSVNTFWCRFNGTWSVNPRFDNSGGTNTSLVMLVFRPTGTNYNWALGNDSVTLGTATTLQTITGITPTNNSNVSIASWHTADNNTWGTLTGTNWINTGLSAQYRNIAGQDGSCTHAYQIQTTAGATNNVSKTQLTLGGDATTRRILNFYEFVANSYNDSVSLNSMHQCEESYILELSESLSINSDSEIIQENINDLQANTSIDSINQFSNSNNLISEVSATISQESNMSNIGGLDFNNVITLYSDNNVTPVSDLTINQNTSISIDAQISEVGNIDVPVSTTLSSVNQLSSLLSLILETNATISSDHSISKSGNVDMVPTVAITQDSQISSGTNLDAQNNIGLQTDNGIIGASSLIINSIAVLQSDSAIVNSNNVSMSEALNFTTDSSLLDNNIGSLVNDIVYLIDGQVSFTYDEFSTMVVDLVSISQMSIEESVTKLAQMQLQLNNDILFGLVMEIYNQISIVSDAGLITVAEVISIINSVLNLGASADSIYSCVQIFNEDYVDLRINTIINFIADLNRTDFSNNEILALKSLITSSFILKSSICDVLLNKSLLVEKQIFQNSLITSEINIKSTITNNININSKID